MSSLLREYRMEAWGRHRFRTALWQVLSRLWTLSAGFALAHDCDEFVRSDYIHCSEKTSVSAQAEGLENISGQGPS